MTEAACIREVTSLSMQQALALAKSHISSLPESSLSQLGKRVTASFYRFVVSSKEEKLFVYFNSDNNPAAACVLSFAPGSIKKRMLLNLPMALSLGVAMAVRVTNFSGESSAPNSNSDEKNSTYSQRIVPIKGLENMPEVLHIFAQNECRGKGIGRHLMAVAQSAVSSRGYAQIVVRTQASINNPALKFYQSLEYVPRQISRDGNKELVLLSRPLQNQT